MLGAGATELASTSDHDAYFYGTADEAAIWTRALTQAEIDSLYTAGVEGAGSGRDGLALGRGGRHLLGQGSAAGDRARRRRATCCRRWAAEVVWGPVVAAPSDPAEDTLVWMPLADCDGTSCSMPATT